MAIKAGKRPPKKMKQLRSQLGIEGDGGYIEVGTGDYCCVTIRRSDGTIFVHRFHTEAEARAQSERNLAQDLPFSGIEAMN